MLHVALRRAVLYLAPLLLRAKGVRSLGVRPYPEGRLLEASGCNVLGDDVTDDPEEVEASNQTDNSSANYLRQAGTPPVLPRAVALAFHGAYHRRTPALRKKYHPTICSDYFANAANINEMVRRPLEAGGVAVTTYFHTYSDPDCPSRDEELVNALQPRAREFSGQLLDRIVDSYIRVLRLALADAKASGAGAVVLLRFDVMYKVPITDLNIDWQAINIAHREGKVSWGRDRKVSDLLFIVPIGRVQSVIKALNNTGQKKCGAGHWMYDPLVNDTGSDIVNFIDVGFSPSNDVFGTTKSFLGINRACSDRKCGGR